MKNLGLFLLTTILAVGLFAGVVFGATLQGFQGGTNYASTTAGNVGNCLKVSTSSPFLSWTIGPCVSGGVPTSTPFTARYLVITSGTSPLSFTDSGIFQSSTGYFGIGTTNPINKLTIVESNTDVDGVAIQNTNGANRSGGLSFIDELGSEGMSIAYNNNFDWGQIVAGSGLNIDTDVWDISAAGVGSGFTSLSDASGNKYVTSTSGSGGGVATSSPWTAGLFAYVVDGNTLGSTSTFRNWLGTWQGVNSTTFYLASNPSGYITSAYSGDLLSLNAIQTAAGATIGGNLSAQDITGDAFTIGVGGDMYVEWAGAGLVYNAGSSALDVNTGYGITIDTDAVVVNTTTLDARYALASVVGTTTISASGTTLTGPTFNLYPTSTGFIVYAQGTSSIFLGPAPLYFLPLIASGTSWNSAYNYVFGSSTLLNSIAGGLFTNIGFSQSGAVNSLATTTVNGNLTSTNITVTGLTSAIPLAGSDGAFTEYAGSACGGSDQVSSISATGVVTCTAQGSGASASTTISRWTVLSNETPSSSFATFDTRNDNPVLDFTATSSRAVFSDVIPQTWTNSSTASVILHLAMSTATTGTVAFGAEFESLRFGVQDMDGGGFATQVSTTATVAGTSGQLFSLTLSMTSSTLDNIAKGDGFRVRINRSTSTAVGDAELRFVELRQ